MKVHGAFGEVKGSFERFLKRFYFSSLLQGFHGKQPSLSVSRSQLATPMLVVSAWPLGKIRKCILWFETAASCIICASKPLRSLLLLAEVDYCHGCSFASGLRPRMACGALGANGPSARPPVAALSA